MTLLLGLASGSVNAVTPGLSSQLGVLDLSANSGINPKTGLAWQVGDTYRLVFVTSTTRDATSSNIADYNAHVQSAANAAGYDTVSWYTIGSTAAVNARVNTNTEASDTDGGFFLIDGQTIIASSIADFWDNDHSSSEAISLNENGALNPILASDLHYYQYSPTWTGTDGDGTTILSYELGAATVYAGLGDSAATVGQWTKRFTATNTIEHYIYAMSDVLQVIDPTADTDGDGITDGTEAQVGTDLQVATDNDQIAEQVATIKAASDGTADGSPSVADLVNNKATDGSGNPLCNGVFPSRISAYEEAIAGATVTTQAQLQAVIDSVNGNPASSYWTPADITTALWFDAADESTITHTTGSVSQWDDKSGTKHATQGDSGKQPDTGTQFLNGRNVIDFNGTSDYVTFSDINIIDKDLFIVFSIDTLPASAVSVMANEGHRTQLPRYQPNGAVIYAGTFWNGGETGTKYTASAGEALIVNAQMTDPSLKWVVNGTEQHTEFKGDGEALGEILSAIGARASNAGGADWHDGQVAEIIITSSTPSASDRQRIEGYLAWKWGLEGNLPNDHPYKSVSPAIPLTWDSSGVDDSVSTANNWDENITPTAGHDVIFNATGDAVTWDSPTTLLNVTLDTGFTGSMTGAADTNLTVASTLTVNAGTLATDAVISAVTYTQGASGALTLTLDSTTHGAYGRINASGTFTAGGTLTIANDGLPLNSATTFDVINGSTITGQFDDIQLPTPAAGYAWDLSNLYTSGEISIIQTPGNLTGISPKLWMAADDAGARNLDGSNYVQAWFDKSGNNYHATVTTQDQAPLYQSSRAFLNNQASFLFDGTDDELPYDGTWLAGTNYTVFVVDARDSSKSENYLGAALF